MGSQDRRGGFASRTASPYYRSALPRMTVRSSEYPIPLHRFLTQIVHNERRVCAAFHNADPRTNLTSTQPPPTVIPCQPGDGFAAQRQSSAAGGVLPELGRRDIFDAFHVCGLFKYIYISRSPELTDHVCSCPPRRLPTPVLQLATLLGTYRRGRLGLAHSPDPFAPSRAQPQRKL